MEGSRIQKEKVADSKISGYEWTGPEALVEGDMTTASGNRVAYSSYLTREVISRF